MGKKQKKNTKGGSGGSGQPPQQQQQQQKQQPKQQQQEQQQRPSSSKSQETVQSQQELSKGAKREIAEYITQLLEVCSKPPESGAKEWEDYPEIHGIVEKIRKIQSVLAPPETNRSQTFGAFLSWLKENGVDTSCVDIVEYPDYGFGLKCVKDLKEAEKMLSVPRKLMMTVDSAKQSGLGPLIAEDKILQVMPNVTLALHLLNEKLQPNSFWKPYIDTLPSNYSTPLYWSTEEVQLLKGSPVQGDSINQYRNISRQYAYFHRLLQKNSAADITALRSGFTYESYRWAVSTVMTRQNQIPAKDGNRAMLGLIPLWDMCNHTNGVYTSDYNLETDSCECFALKDYSVDQQVLIFYGPRSNGEFLVHNGFVYPDNEHDRLCLKLGISKSDSLFALKSELLGKINLASSRSFYLHRGKFPIDGDLLAFLRVFCMGEETLKDQYSGDSAPSPEELETLKDEDKPVSNENEGKVWAFLHTRATILLKAYPSSLEEDMAIAEKLETSSVARMAAQLKVCERQILKNVIEYAEGKKEKFSSS